MFGKKYNNNDVLHYIKNTAWLMSEKFLGLGAALIISVWIAKHLGPIQFGQLSFAQSFASLFVAVAALGLTRILERDLVDQTTSRQPIVSTAFYLVFAGGVFAYGLMYVFLRFRGYDSLSQELILIVGMTAFLQVNTVFISHFLSQVNAKPYVISNVIALTVSNIVKICFILLDAPLYYFAFGFVLDGLLLFPILMFVVYGSDAQPRFSMVSKNIAISLLRNSWPYILTGLLITIYMKIDTIMLKEMIGDYAVGQYSAAAKLSEGLYYIPVTIVASIYPAIVRAKRLGEVVYNQRLKSLYSSLFYLALVISVFISLLAPSIISLLYGDDYTPAVSVLVIHVWASVFVFVSMASGRWLLTENLQLLSIANTFVGVCINVGLNYFLIPIYGIEGAAFATVVSYGASGFFCFAIWRKSRPNFYLMTKSIFYLPRLQK